MRDLERRRKLVGVIFGGIRQSRVNSELNLREQTISARDVRAKVLGDYNLYGGYDVGIVRS